MSVEDRDSGAEQDYYEPEQDDLENASQASDATAMVAHRLNQMEETVSKLALQQDTYRGLTAMKNEVDRAKKLDKDLKKAKKVVDAHAQQIADTQSQLDEFSGDTERNLRTLEKQITQEQSRRVLENKQVKRVCEELEKRLKKGEMESELQYKSCEAACREEILSVANEMDRQGTAHKEYLENKIDSVHHSLKTTIVEDQDAFRDLLNRVESLEA